MFDVAMAAVCLVSYNNRHVRLLSASSCLRLAILYSYTDALR